MSIPTDVKQQKSLSEMNKKKVHKTMKNILTSPYNQSWYPIQGKDLKLLQEFLERNLPALKKIKTRISWKHLKDLSKEERVEILIARRKKIRETESNQPLFHKRSYLSLGLNETSKCLHRNHLSCILVDGDSSSKRVGSFLVNLALTKNTPVVVCPGLLSLTLSKFGFKCLAFGIKENVTEASNVHQLIALQNLIIRTFTKHPLTIEPILCDKFKQILNEIENELAMEESVSLQGETICDASIKGDNDNFHCSDRKMYNITSVGQQSTEILNTNFLYRYRENKSYRVFVPDRTNICGSDNSEISENFIAVASEDVLGSGAHKGISMKTEVKSQDHLIFIDTGGLVKPPVVKKLKHNPKRVRDL